MNADAVMIGSVLGVIGTVVVVIGLVIWGIKKINQDYSDHKDL